MLASTVQFSNNDQPPATPPHKGGEYTGAGIRRKQASQPAPSDTQQRARPDPPGPVFHTPREGQY